jgi:uncharacterized protein YbaA (DUF1428 family)
MVFSPDGRSQEEPMARYVDGFVIALPKKKLGAYRKMARLGAKVWKEHGALEYYECVGDDLEAQYGMMPFPKLARLKKGETVVFSWIVYRSRKHRDSVNAKVMRDPRLNSMDLQNMPFDMKRTAYGGFETLVYW